MSYQITYLGQIQRLSDGAFIPKDITNPDYRDYLAWENAGNSPTAEDGPSVESRVVEAIQQRLDAWARQRGYDGIGNFVKFRDSQVPRFQADYLTSVRVLDEQWGGSLKIKLDVLAGLRPVPTYEEAMAELPPLPAWPAD